MDITKLAVQQKPVQIANIAVNEKIGRISIDGSVSGKLVAAVFMSQDVPKTVRTEDQMQRFMEKKLLEAAESGGNN